MVKQIKLRVLIVEDELIIAEALKVMLEGMGYQCAAIVDNLEEGQKEIDSSNFDMAILDVNLAGNHEGVALGKQCTTIGKPFFFLTSYSDRETVLKAKGAKPGAYVIKPFVPEEIMVAIEMTLLHQSAEETQMTKRVICELGLSKREGDVLDCLLERLSTSEIAEKLFVSQNTVKFHVKNLYFKLNASNRSEMLERVEEISLQG